MVTLQCAARRSQSSTSAKRSTRRVSCGIYFCRTFDSTALSLSSDAVSGSVVEAERLHSRKDIEQSNVEIGDRDRKELTREMLNDESLQKL